MFLYDRMKQLLIVLYGVQARTVRKSRERERERERKDGCTDIYYESSDP